MQIDIPRNRQTMKEIETDVQLGEKTELLVHNRLFFK